MPISLSKYCDIHSAYNGIVCDSSDIDKTKLCLEESTIHNCQGFGLQSVNSNIVVLNSQITNTLNNCIYIDGGNAAFAAKLDTWIVPAIITVLFFGGLITIISWKRKASE